MVKVVWHRVGHKHQRYDTIGDWYWGQHLAEKVLIIKTSILQDFRSELLVFCHELVEAMACLSVGITAEQVDEFDMGVGKDLDEPGDDPRAPYHSQHKLASAIELQLCNGLGISWSDHEYYCTKYLDYQEIKPCQVFSLQVTGLPDALRICSSLCGKTCGGPSSPAQLD